MELRVLPCPTTQESWTLVASEPLTSDLNKGCRAMALSSSDLLGTNCLDSDAGGWEYPLSEWEELGAGGGLGTNQAVHLNHKVE